LTQTGAQLTIIIEARVIEKSFELWNNMAKGLHGSLARRVIILELETPRARTR
jgi:hypothetical protein